MERISRDRVLLDMAAAVSQRGTCSRLQVGVVFSRSGRVISTGYNGAPAGLPHCDHNCTCGEGNHKASPLRPHAPLCPWPGPCLIATHAEANGIAFAARHGVKLLEADMHVTHMPCQVCAKLIINAGISRVIYWAPYRETTGLDLLTQAGVEVLYFENGDFYLWPDGVIR